ncbi:MAG: tetratricopeptide repeat protein [Myxococcaceae bacterium]|nr:tetratricopeptide repeat protein [Myxococcaceae bacterium]
MTTEAREKQFAEVEASLEKSGRVEELIKLYEARSREVPNPDEGGHLLAVAGGLARERLRNPQRAEELLRRALVYAPHSREALEGLKALYEARQEHQLLAEVLERLGGATEGVTSAAYYLKAADLFEHKLSRPDRVVLCCQLAARAAPGERQASRRARKILLDEGRAAAAWESLERESALLGDREMVEDLVLFAERLADDPQQHGLVGKALERIFAQDEKNARALAVKKSVEALGAAWRDRVKALRSASLEERDRHAAARLSLQVARLYAHYDPNATQKLKEAIDRCFLLWPAMPDALQLLEDVAARQGDYGPAIALFEKLAGESRDKTAQVDLRLRVGMLQLTKANDRAAAIASFEKAVAIDPSRADAVGLTAELVMEDGRVSEGIALLEKHLGSLRSKAAQAELLLRLSDLCANVAKDPARARKHLDAANQLEPGNAQIAWRLAQLMVAGAEAKEAWKLAELAVSAPRPMKDRVALCEAFSLLFEEAGEPEKAFQSLAWAVPLDPGRAGLLSGLMKAAAAAGTHEALARTLRRGVQVARPQDAIRLWRALGQTLAGPLARPGDALEAWDEVLRRAPDDVEATQGVAAARKALIQEPQDPRQKLEADARRLEASAADPAAAAEVYRKILELDPTSVPTLKKLGNACATLGKWEELAGVAQRLMAVADSPAERQEWCARLAQLYAERLDQRDEAARLFLNLLEQGATLAAVIGGLERLASQGVRQAEISRALAPHYAKVGDHQRQVASLLVQLSSVQDREEQKGLLSLLAEVTEQRLLDERQALELRMRGVALDPTDVSFRAEAMRLARQNKAHAELSRFFSELSTKGNDAALSAALLQDAAALADEGGAVDDAAKALAGALERKPEDPGLLSRLVSLYWRAQRWSDCDQALRRRILVADAAEKAPLSIELARVNRELKRPREAATALQDAIRAGADEAALLPQVAVLLEESGRAAELSQVLERLEALAEKAGDGDRAAALALKRAKLIETSLGDTGQAIQRYAEVLARRPGDAQAIEALEKLLSDEQHREEAARVLLGVFEAARDHRKEVQVLQVIADSTKDAGERLIALQRAAHVQGQFLKQHDQAFGSMARAVQVAPGDAQVRTRARAAAEAADSIEAYADILADLIEQDVGPAAPAMHWELAELYEKRLGSPEAATKHLEALRKLDPKHLEALRALLRLYRSKEQWPQVVDVLEQLALLESDPGAKTDLDREAAQISELRLNDPARAAANWRQIAQRDALARDAAAALDRLYQQLQQPHELAFVLELRRNQEGQSPPGRELAFRLAQLRQTTLEDPQGALQLYRQILTEDGGHVAARDALEAWARAGVAESDAAMAILDPVLAQAGDHARRIALREGRASQGTPLERTRLAAEVRAILERDLGQPQAAFMSALKAFAAGLDRDAVRPELERLAQQTQSFEELAEVYETTAEDLGGQDAEALSLLRRAAQVREHLGQSDEAVKDWQAVLAVLPQDHEALEALSKLYARSQNAKSLSEVYAKQAQLATEPAERFELLTKAAEAYEAAGQDAQAIDAWKAAHAISKTEAGLQALERLFSRTKQWAEQADALDQIATSSKDSVVQSAALSKRAGIFEREGQHAEAVRSWARVLAISETDPAALAGLERLFVVDVARLDAAKLLEAQYRAVKEHRKLVEVLEVLLPTVDPARRQTTMAEIAVLREAIGHKPLAFAMRLRMFAEVPDDEATVEELERLAADLGSFEELAAAFEDQLERGLVEPLAGSLWRRLGVIYGERLERPDLATRAWSQVLQREPKNVFVLDALARLHRKTSNYRELATIMRRQLALETDASAQVNLLYELANLAEEMLVDKQLAAQCYAAILERRPEDQNAIRFLGRLLAETERYPELATLIGREVQLAEARGAKEEAWDLMVRLGRLKLQRLADPKGALAQYQEVLRRKPAHAGAIGAIEEMARSDSSLKGEAAATLEPVFASEGEHLKLVQMLESRVEAEPNPQERVVLLKKITEVYSQQMDNSEMAFVSAARALRELPDDPRSLELVLQLAGPADAQDELLALLSEVSPRAAEDKARANLYRALARAHDAQGDAEESVEAWKRVLEIDPGDPEGLETLSRLLGKQGRTGELLDVLKRQLAMAEDTARRAALMFQVGVLLEEQQKDLAGALVTFRRLLELKPDDPATLERMDRLCEAQERWPELADVLARRLTLITGDGLFQAKYRLGLLRETKLLDKAGAIELYTDLLAANPTHPGALQRMEALVAREPQNLSAVEVLLKAYRASGEMGKLAQVIEARVAVAPDAEERKALFVELAAARDAQEEPELSYLALWRAFKEDPNDRALRARLESAADAAKVWDELAGAYEEELPRVVEQVDSAEICVKLGQLYEQRLRESEQAVQWYEKARELHPSVASRVLPSLDRLYGQLDRPLEQANALDSLSALVKEPNEKVAMLFRLGQLASERLDSPDRAAGAYERLLDIDPNHLPSLRSLEQLYDQAKSHDKLYRVLERQKELVQGTEKDRLLQKMAAVSSEGLADVGHSIELYRELLTKNPRNEQAFAALDVLLERAKRFDELRELLESKLKVTIDPRELVRLNERLGRVIAVHQGAPQDAIPYFKAALERDARHKGALEALRDIYQAAGQRDDLVIVLRRLIPLQDDSAGVKGLRVQLSEVLAAGGRREEALDAARRALEVEPHTVAELERVFAIFSSLKAYGDAVRALEAKSSVLLVGEDREGAIQALFAVADLQRDVVGKPELGGPALEKVLEIDPAHRAAYERALELYSAVKDWRAYALAMERYLPNLVTDEEKLASLRTLAQVQEQKLGQKDVAFLQMCRALQLNPNDSTVRDEVERLAEETSSYEELAAVYEEVADALPRGPLAERMYLTLAKVHDERLDDVEAAESALRKILEFDPTNEGALEALSAMFARRGQAKEYIVALEQKLEAAPSIEKRKEILRDISRVYAERLDNHEEAVQALQRALELEPDLETLSTLAGLQRARGEFPAVASTLMRMRDLSPTPEDRARLQVEIAQVYERDLQDDEGAVESYRHALEFDPASALALDSLERLYTKLDRPAELLQVYERQIELAQDYRERVKTLFKCAAIWEDRYQNLPNADACIEAVLQLDPQNLQAIKALERLRKAQERWDELIGVIDRHIQLLTHPAEKAELCVELGDIFHQQLKLVDRAVAAYHQALEIDPKCRPALHALGTLYERSGNWPFALDMLEKEAKAAGQSADAVELFHRMGKINEDMLLDSGSAKRCYLEALAIDPAYLPCIRALKGLYSLEKDYENYEKALVEEAVRTEEPEAKSQANLEVARYYLEQKDDRDTSVAYFEEALRLSPASTEAARPLADIYVAREQWDAAERMLEIVTRGLEQDLAAAPDDGDKAKELCRQEYRLGYVAEKLGKKDRALGAYGKAYQLDSTYLPALEGYGHLLVSAKKFDEALKVYQSILIHHRDDLTDLEVVEIYWTLGDIHVQQKQLDRAENHFEKALAIDPGHEPSLRSRIALHEAAGKWDRAAEDRQKLVQVLDGEGRFEVALALGKLAREKLNDAYMAIDAYLAAHRIKEDVLEVMDALYVLYRETKQGHKAAEILEKMLATPALQGDPQKAKRVYFALGEIRRDEVMDLEGAVEAFNAALDADYKFIEAFSALEAMLGKARKWKTLDDNYKRMIGRLPKGEETHAARMTLWKALGDLYLKVMKAPDAATEVYKVVAAGMPDDAAIQEQYAELAQQQPGHEQSAVDAWRRALPSTSNPGRVASALAELAARRKDYDSAWLAAQVAAGLIGEIGAGEKEILQKLTPYAKKKEVAQRALTDRLWQTHLFHPKVRGPMAELMAILFEQAGHLYKEDFARYQVNPKRHLIDVGQSNEYQLSHFKYVSRLLGMEQVALYSPFLVTTRERNAKKTSEPAPDPTVGVEMLHTHPMSLKVGGKFFSETGQKEVQYLLGRTLALMRPELAMSQRLSGERLEAVFQAALSLSVDRFRFSADPRAIDAERKLLEKALTEQARAALRRVTGDYVRNASPNDLRNYLEGAELSAVRAGLFAAGEIEPVKKLVMGETGPHFRVQTRSKIRDLMVFALSEDLHALRVAVGTNVEVVARAR